MKKFRDVLSRWEAGEVSMMEAASCLGCRSGSSGAIGGVTRRTGLARVVGSGGMRQPSRHCTASKSLIEAFIGAVSKARNTTQLSQDSGAMD
jgi:hypothetical protein